MSDSGAPPADGSRRGTGATSGRRRRSFVAAAAQQTKTTRPALPKNDEDDLPVLTEVVVPQAPTVRTSEAEPERIDEAVFANIAAELVRSLEQQLAIELPTLIEATLLNTQNELRAGINSTLELALRDFLARRQQLCLPLEEPEAEIKGL